MNIVSPSQLDTNNPGTWPLIYKVILWVVVIGIMLFVYNRFVRSPILEEQAIHQQEIETLKTEYQQLYQYTLDLPKYQERSKELVGILQGLLIYLPSKENMDDLIAETYMAARKYGINVDNFTPMSNLSEEYYDIKPISLNTETGFSNFAQFGEQISGLDRILNISSMTLDVNGTDNNKLLKIDSEMQTYIYTSDFQKFIDEVGVKEFTNEN